MSKTMTLEVPMADHLEERLDSKLAELQQIRERPAQASLNRVALQQVRVPTKNPLAYTKEMPGWPGAERRAPGMLVPMRAQEARLVLDSIRDERTGTLARLVGYLEENGVVEGRPRTFEERHVVQKYTYLANAFGEPPHYEFAFLENGAYSPALALDLYAKARGGAGATPFEKNPRAGEVFVQMVQGRGRRTLQAMTFAMRDMLLGTGRDEFVGTMLRERGLYDRRLLEWAFDRVSEARERLGGG